VDAPGTGSCKADSGAFHLPFWGPRVPDLLPNFNPEGSLAGPVLPASEGTLGWYNKRRSCAKGALKTHSWKLGRHPPLGAKNGWAVFSGKNSCASSRIISFFWQKNSMYTQRAFQTRSSGFSKYKNAGGSVRQWNSVGKTHGNCPLEDSGNWKFPNLVNYRRGIRHQHTSGGQKERS